MKKTIFYPSLLAFAVTQASVATAQQSAQLPTLEEEIVVTGVKAADQNARNIEREKSNFSSVIATDDLGNFVDQNIAESLRRLPGVNLQRSEGEGQFVTVRGLGPGFVTVNINGSETASAANDTRVFGLNLLSNDMIGSIEVHKTLTPDMNLNSIGGSVNIKSISAFDRNRDSLLLRLQGSYQEARGEAAPKLSAVGTKLLFNEKLGFGFTLSHESRQTLVDEIRHHSTDDMMFRQQDIPSGTGPTILAPRQLETRQEIANRERTGGSMNIELRPHDNHEFYIRLNHSTLADEDIALREFFDFQDAGNGDTAFVNADTKEFIVSDVDVFHQYFVQDITTSISSFNIGAEHLIGDGFVFDYEYAHSKSEASSPNRRRVQFREQDLVVLGQGGSDFIRGEIITPQRGAELGGFTLQDYANGSTDGNANNLGNFHYDNLLLEDSFRTDIIDSFSTNLRKEFNESRIHYLQAGIVARARTRDRNKDRSSFDPGDGTAGCNGDSACLAATDSNWLDYERIASENVNFTYPFITAEEFEQLVALTSVTRDAAIAGDISIDGTKEDYTLEEDTNAAYVMAEIGLSKSINLIAGVRYESTELSSKGFFSIENDDFQFGNTENEIDIAIPMSPLGNRYSNLFPSMHLNWEASEKTLLRAALWTSFTRPAFNQTITQATIDNDIELCVPGTRENGVPGTGDCDDDYEGGNLADYELARNNSIQVGNPTLSPMTATNFDASLGWYPRDELFLQAAIFYKAIDDFIVDVSGAEVALNELPVDLPLDRVNLFTIPNNLVLTNVDFATNGDSATVYGLELSYVQYFNLGFFIQSNATLMNSEATLDESIRAEPIQLPDQANSTANFTIGWENKTFSASLINNYRSKVLERIGACPASVNQDDAENCKIWADRFQDALFTTDIKFRYTFNEYFNIFFDVLNITENSDRRYFQGNELSGGEMLYQLEEYGTSFQLGGTFDL